MCADAAARDGVQDDSGGSNQTGGIYEYCIPLWFLLILCFSVPQFNMAGKVLWVFLTYNLCQSVCYTFVTVSSSGHSEYGRHFDHAEI